MRGAVGRRAAAVGRARRCRRRDGLRRRAPRRARGPRPRSIGCSATTTCGPMGAAARARAATGAVLRRAGRALAPLAAGDLGTLAVWTDSGPSKARTLPVGRVIVGARGSATWLFAVTAVPVALGVDASTTRPSWSRSVASSPRSSIWCWALGLRRGPHTRRRRRAGLTDVPARGSRAARVRWHLYGSLVVCLAITIATAAANPFGVLVPMYPARSGRACGAPATACTRRGRPCPESVTASRVITGEEFRTRDADAESADLRRPR